MEEFKDVYSVVCIYDPTVEGSTRQLIVERYMENGRDVTAKVVAEHTRLLLNVVAINTAVDIMEQEGHKYEGLALDSLKHYQLRRAQAKLEQFEERFRGIKNYRSYRTPFK